MVKTRMMVEMEDSKLPPQTKQHKKDILEVKVIGKKRSLRRKTCSDEMLHNHQLEEVRVQIEKSNVSSNDHDSLPSLDHNNVERSHISAHHEHFTPNHNEKTVEGNPISIPILDSPSTRTRSALRRKETTSNGNRLESEDHIISKHPLETTILPKRTRGPTKMKTIAIDKQSKVNLVFNEYGQPIGDESVGLASFLGPLVREVVPVTLENWKKLPTRLKIVLWKSIQSRYNVNEDWQKTFFFQKMGRLWRTGKSRLDRIEQTEAMTINSTYSVVDDALSKVLGPDRGHVRGFGFGVTRSKLSLLSQQDSKYKILENEYLRMKEEMVEMKAMKEELIEMRTIMSCLLKKHVEPSDEFSNGTASVLKPTNIPSTFPLSSPSSINNNTQAKCKLLDWHDSGDIVAEGRWSSNDPTTLVHHTPLGPNVVRVWVDIAKKPNAYLWRPTSEMTCI